VLNSCLTSYYVVLTSVYFGVLSCLISIRASFALKQYLISHESCLIESTLLVLNSCVLRASLVLISCFISA